MPKEKIQTRFKNELQASHVARQIAQDQHRGSQTENRIETVLNQLREATGIKSLKQINQGTVRAFVDTLRDRLNSGELSSATTSSYVSALNSIIKYIDEHLNKTLETVSAQECGLSRGEFKFYNDIVPQDIFEQYKEFLSDIDDIRAQALAHSIELQRELGLRLQESIRVQRTNIEQALKTGVLTIGKVDGTKNGQARSIEIKYDSQQQALRKALEFQKEHGLRSLIPKNLTTKQQKNYAQNIRRAFNRANNTKMDYHGNRKYFLSNEAYRYGLKYATEEAGHHREDVMRHYVPNIGDL